MAVGSIQQPLSNFKEATIMAKKIKHQPADLSVPSLFSKVDFTTINEQEPFFIQVRNGKEPFVKDWKNTGTGYHDAIVKMGQGHVSSGIALNHKPSKTVAFDIDDVEKTKAYFMKEFNDDGQALDAILDNTFRIKSPKPNRDKAIFMLTDEQLEQLDEIGGNQIIQHTDDDGAVVFEIRGRGGQDVFPPSLYLAVEEEGEND